MEAAMIPNFLIKGLSAEPYTGAGGIESTPPLSA
jgi:hypothetical protein